MSVRCLRLVLLLAVMSIEDRKKTVWRENKNTSLCRSKAVRDGANTSPRSLSLQFKGIFHWELVKQDDRQSWHCCEWVSVGLWAMRILASCASVLSLHHQSSTPLGNLWNFISSTLISSGGGRGGLKPQFQSRHTVGPGWKSRFCASFQPLDAGLCWQDGEGAPPLHTAILAFLTGASKSECKIKILLGRLYWPKRHLSTFTFLLYFWYSELVCSEYATILTLHLGILKLLRLL